MAAVANDASTLLRKKCAIPGPADRVAEGLPALAGTADVKVT